MAAYDLINTAGRLTAGLILGALCQRTMEQNGLDGHANLLGDKTSSTPLFQRIYDTAPRVRRVLLGLNYLALERPTWTPEQRLQAAVDAVADRLLDEDMAALLAALTEASADLTPTPQSTSRS